MGWLVIVKGLFWLVALLAFDGLVSVGLALGCCLDSALGVVVNFLAEHSEDFE